VFINQIKESTMKALTLSLVLGLILLGSTVALGDNVESTRCGENVIEVGDSVVTVMEKCGEPTRRGGGGGFNTLYYDFGSGESIKVFHIEDEKVDSIEEVSQ
jgi:hypothetical protein